MNERGMRNKKDMKNEKEKRTEGVLDAALRREKREQFLEYRIETWRDQDEVVEEMVSYLRSEECERDIRRLKQGDIFFSVPFHYQLPKNFSQRKRNVYAWKGKERYLLNLLAFLVHDHDEIYSDGLYSFRAGVSARDFLTKLHDFPDLKDCYVLKADISEYANSIVPEMLVAQLEEIWAEDPEFLGVMKFLLLRKECMEKDGSVVSCEPGCLSGNPLASHFMNVYLMEMDDYFQEKSQLYCRYSDDVVVLARDREEAEGFYTYFLRTLEKMKLRTNEEKTRLLAPGEVVDILGCRVENGEIDISEHTIQKIKRRLRIFAKGLLWAKREKGLSDREAAEAMAKRCTAVFFGTLKAKDVSWARWMFPIITVVDSLKELDRYMQDTIRYVYCGSLGRKRYRLRYEQLKELGYRNVVHDYYHSTWNKNREKREWKREKESPPESKD